MGVTSFFRDLFGMSKPKEPQASESQHLLANGDRTAYASPAHSTRTPPSSATASPAGSAGTPTTSRSSSPSPSPTKATVAQVFAAGGGPLVSPANSETQTVAAYLVQLSTMRQDALTSSKTGVTPAEAESLKQSAAGFQELHELWQAYIDGQVIKPTDTLTAARVAIDQYNAQPEQSTSSTASKSP